MTTEILILLLAFQIKHLIADYYLQFPYMYENKGKENGWILPLTNHALIHTIGTMLIAGGYLILYNETRPNIDINIFIISLALFDFLSHFITDRWKATRKTNPSESWFWRSLGIDQMIHHIVGIIIIYIIVQ